MKSGIVLLGLCVLAFGCKKDNYDECDLSPEVADLSVGNGDLTQYTSRDLPEVPKYDFSVSQNQDLFAASDLSDPSQDMSVNTPKDLLSVYDLTTTNDLLSHSDLCLPYCGDGVCGANEDCKSCSIDCGQCPPTCDEKKQSCVKKCDDDKCSAEQKCTDDFKSCKLDCDSQNCGDYGRYKCNVKCTYEYSCCSTSVVVLYNECVKSCDCECKN